MEIGDRILFPAHAGVILLLDTVDVDMLAFPRTRGGDPSPLFVLDAV